MTLPHPGGSGDPSRARAGAPSPCPRPPRDSHHGRVRRDAAEHDASRADFRALPDFDIPEDFRPRADQHSRAYFGMPVSRLLPRSSQGDIVKHRDIVLHDRGFADDHRSGVIDQDSLADSGGGMNIDREDFRNAALEIKRQAIPSLQPQPVGHPVGLQRVESFEIQ